MQLLQVRHRLTYWEVLIIWHLIVSDQLQPGSLHTDLAPIRVLETGIGLNFNADWEQDQNQTKEITNFVELMTEINQLDKWENSSASCPAMTVTITTTSSWDVKSWWQSHRTIVPRWPTFQNAVACIMCGWWSHWSKVSRSVMRWWQETIIQYISDIIHYKGLQIEYHVPYYHNWDVTDDTVPKIVGHCVIRNGSRILEGEGWGMGSEWWASWYKVGICCHLL